MCPLSNFKMFPPSLCAHVWWLYNLDASTYTATCQYRQDYVDKWCFAFPNISDIQKSKILLEVVQSATIFPPQKGSMHPFVKNCILKYTTNIYNVHILGKETLKESKASVGIFMVRMKAVFAGSCCLDHVELGKKNVFHRIYHGMRMDVDNSEVELIQHNNPAAVSCCK